MRSGEIVRTGPGGPWRRSTTTIAAGTAAGAGINAAVTRAENFTRETRTDSRDCVTSVFADAQVCGTLRTTVVALGAETSAVE
jgi:hypothetical protein